MVDIDDPRPYAHMVQKFRESEKSVAQKVAMINILWGVYDSIGEIDEDDYSLDRAEAEQILSELPTTYDIEEEA